MLESPSLQLMSALFFDDFASLDDLAEALFISLSTLKRLIRKTNLYLKEHFDIIISAKPIRVVGDEYNIRLFTSSIFQKHIPFLNGLLLLYLMKTTMSNLFN
ncbi:helix-turn-helix domain-containing protein [Streptococcus equi]|uniref:helix-turn-helix domain-containing protein n=1 Tax=Streptococcus equi TaxID=1336 RepID=UPI001E45843B|nr:helix-turn-helix domain-containing protein [Streptococcus equi]